MIRTHALSCTNAHCRDQNLLLLPSALAQASDNLSCTCAAQWMPESNGTSSWVHLLPVQLERISAVNSHASEGLVQLEDVDVVNGQSVLAQKLGHGNRWTDTHDARCETCNGGADVLGENWLVKLEGLAALHEKDCSGAVGDLGGVAASRLVTKGWEGWANLIEGFKGCAPAWALILGQGDVLAIELDGDGCDLVVEETSFLRSFRSSVALSCITILLFTGDVEVRANVLRCLTHGLHAVAGVLVGVHDVVNEGTGEGVTAGGHGLSAKGDTDLDGARGDLIGDVLNGFEAGGAEAVYAGAGGSDGEASGEEGGAAVVGCFGVGDL